MIMQIVTLWIVLSFIFLGAGVLATAIQVQAARNKTLDKKFDETDPEVWLEEYCRK